MVGRGLGQSSHGRGRSRTRKEIIQSRGRLRGCSLDDDMPGQPLNVIFLAGDRTRTRTRTGSIPEHRVVPCKNRSDPEAYQYKQSRKKGGVDNPVVVSGL